MSTEHNVFSGAYVDRAAEHRTDARWQAQALAEASTRFVLVKDGKCLASKDDGRLALVTKSIAPFKPEPSGTVFLGLFHRQPVFAMNLGTFEVGEFDEGEFVSLRSLGALLSPDEANLAAHACAIVQWQDTQLFCSRCGHSTEIEAAGYSSLCTNAQCATRSFPRVDPAIIVLVTRDDRCLLGRQASWPEGIYSTIAGFVEPGESLEDSVVREVFEETNIRVSGVRYESSQPWPFPASLMLGFRALAETEDLKMNDGELEDVRWFSHAQLSAGDIKLPTRQSISRRLVDTWLAENQH